MTKKELRARIEALEAQVAMLAAQVAQQQPHVYYHQTAPLPYPNTFPQITCGGSVGPTDGLVAINGGAA